MNKRQALSALADELLGKLVADQVETEKYGSWHAQKGSRDHERIMDAYDELGYRLAKIVHPATRRKPEPVAADPNQVPLFE